MLSYTVTVVESRLLSLQPTCYLAMYGPGWFRIHIEQRENIEQQKEKVKAKRYGKEHRSKHYSADV